MPVCKKSSTGQSFGVGNLTAVQFEQLLVVGHLQPAHSLLGTRVSSRLPAWGLLNSDRELASMGWVAG